MQPTIQTRKSAVADEPADVREELNKVLSAPEFVASERMSEFLRFVVEETLNGRADRIKQYTIATKVFERDSSFDQQSDPVVRVQAAKVRRALQQYYLEEGRKNPIRIEIKKGTYVPSFILADDSQDAGRLSPDRRSQPPVVAVIPFANGTGDSSNDYLASGLAEDLSTELSRFAGVSVIAYYSAKQLADEAHDVRRLGKLLKADYLLTGSLRQAESDFRASIQLCSTKDEHQLWGERFNRALTTHSLHEVQDEVIHEVLAQVAGRYGAIHEHLGPATRRVDHASLSGYEAVLRSLYYDKTLAPQDYTDALAALQAATHTDPTSPIVLARLAIMYLDSHAFGMDAIEDACGVGIQYAELATSLDRNSADAQYALAWSYLVRRDRHGLEEAARRLIKLSPGEAYLVGTGGWFLALAGYLDEGLDIIRRSLRLNPKCPTWFHFIPYLVHYQKEDYESALSEANLLGIPQLFWDPLLKASALGHLGRTEAAQSELELLLRLRPDFADEAERYVGVFFLDQTQRDKLLAGLELAGLE